MPSTANLGEPLQLSIPLRLEPGEDLNANCVNADVAFADNHQSAGNISIRIDPAPPGALGRVLRIVSATRVDEPLVTVDLRLGCTSTVSRRFTLFADPPLLMSAGGGVPQVASPPVASGASAEASTPSSQAQAAEASSAVPPPDGVTAPAVPDALAGGAAQAPAPRKTTPSSTPRASNPKPARVASGPRTPRPAAASTPAGRPRLQVAPLEPSLAMAPTPGELAASAAAAEQAARAASAAQAEAAARAKVDQLTAVVAKLQSDGDAAAKRIAALEAKLQAQPKAPTSADDSWPWYYPALLVLFALLILLVVWKSRQRSGLPTVGSWMQPTALRATGVDDIDSELPSEAFPDVAPPAPSAHRASRAGGLESVGGTPSPKASAPALASMQMAVPVGPLVGAGGSTAAAAALRELSVEELLDLEQQADFFLVLGQDDAAIDLLLNHLVSTAGGSPLPYLKLLEIYKRRDERNNYEQLRERFNKRFNAYAPVWETDLQAGHSLEDYPPVMRRLEALWFDPRRAMTVLEATLVRAAGAAEDEAAIRESFDLPAYRELLLLYSVARDRAEVEESAPVDLQLPIADSSGPGNYGTTYERLLATTPIQAQPAVQRPLEVDLALEELELPTTDPGMLLVPPERPFAGGEQPAGGPASGPAAAPRSESSWSPLGPDNCRR